MPVAVVHRHRQRGLALRRDAGVRRHRPAHLQPRPGRGRAGDHAAHQGDHARAPDRPAGRHGRVPRARREHGLAIVEDAACAIGATLQGPADRLARAARLLLAAPAQGDHHRRGRHDHDERRRARRRACASCASTRWTSPTSRATTPTDVVFECYPERGWNCRMTDLQAAVGLCQLEALDEILAERTRQAERYNAALAGAAAPRGRRSSPGYTMRTWQSYAVRVGPGAAVGRTELMRRLHPRRRRDAPRHHGDPPRGAPTRGADLLLPHTEAAARDVHDAAAVPRPGDDAQDYVIDRLAAHVVAAGRLNRCEHDSMEADGIAAADGDRIRSAARVAASTPSRCRALDVVARGAAADRAAAAAASRSPSRSGSTRPAGRSSASSGSAAGCRPFTVNKFRTMRADADHDTHRAFVLRLITGEGGDQRTRRAAVVQDGRRRARHARRPPPAQVEPRRAAAAVERAARRHVARRPAPADPVRGRALPGALVRALRRQARHDRPVAGQRALRADARGDDRARRRLRRAGARSG